MCIRDRTYDDMERLLDEQLGRLQTDHLDFYLLHALNQKSFHDIQALDYQKFLNDLLRKGKIRYPGFSFHDNAEVFREILNDFDWKLAQVQMNVRDEDVYKRQVPYRTPLQSAVSHP